MPRRAQSKIFWIDSVADPRPRKDKTFWRQFVLMVGGLMERPQNLRIWLIIKSSLEILKLRENFSRGFIELFRRGRNASYLAPPTQIPAWSFPSRGSSVVLASVTANLINDKFLHCYSPQWGLLMLIRSCMSGISFLCGLRTSVRSFPM